MPRVLAELSRVVRTLEIVSPARASTVLTSPTRPIVRACSFISEEVPGWNAACTRAPTEGSVTRPGCTLMSKFGELKSFASTTRVSVALEPICGGARIVAHWTCVVPSEAWLSTPLVAAPFLDAVGVTTEEGLTPLSAVEATTVSGAPTSAAWEREAPFTS